MNKQFDVTDEMIEMMEEEQKMYLAVRKGRRAARREKMQKDKKVYAAKRNKQDRKWEICYEICLANGWDTDPNGKKMQELMSYPERNLKFVQTKLEWVGGRQRKDGK